jgi:MFS family permease
MSGSRYGELLEPTPEWGPTEAPALPGSPSTPVFPTPTRIAYGLVGLLLGVTGAVGSSLMSVNLPFVQGALGLTPTEVAWIGAAYVMGGVSMNLLIIKYRQQFGLGNFLAVFLGLFAFAAVAQIFIGDPHGVFFVRLLSGIAGAAMTTFSVFYLLQAFDARLRLVSLVIGIGLPQLGFPMARLLSPALLDIGDWTQLYWLEAGLALACVACVVVLPLPRGVRIRVFERGDLLSFGLLTLGFGLLTAVVAQGRLQWWLEAPWIGWALAASIGLLVVAAVIEHQREHPLVDTRWVLTPGFLRFTVSVLLVRVLLAEQTFGVPGLLQVTGVGPDQLQMLHLVILIAAIVGIMVGSLLIAMSPKFILLLELAAPALIAVAAFMDAGSSALSNPQSFYVSQAIIGFAGPMFMAAAFMLGFLMLFMRGASALITFVVAFSVTQMLGGLLGPTLLGTFQAVRASHHGAYLAEQIAVSDPQTAATVHALSLAQSAAIVDPALQQAAGVTSMAQQAAQQANILAFNDVFLIIGIVALIHLIVSIPAVLAIGMKLKNAAIPGATPPEAAE